METFYNEVISGEVGGGTTTAQMPNVPCSRVNIKALGTNSTNIYIGGANVTIPAGTTDTTSGITLDAGEETGWMNVDNLNRFWMITDSNSDDATYIALK